MARNFCRSEEIFHDQIYEPSRIPARYLLSIREGADKSTKLHGFVFARTAEFYDNNFGSNMRILSVIVPQLGATLSLRCRSTVAESIIGEMVEVNGVQPVPFVNRIHTTSRLSIQRKNESFSLQRLHFLRVSIHDLSHICPSLAFENLCEVQSAQAGNRRLGLPCVITGRVLSIDSPYVWIEDETKRTFVKLLITQFLVKQVGGSVAGLSVYKSKPARFLAMVWYALGTREPPITEVFRIEPMDESNLSSEDAIGYVRLLGETTKADLSTRYPSLDIDSLPEILSQDSNFVSWAVSTNPTDALSQDFVRHTAQLLRFRLTRGSPWIWAARPSQVFDKTRLAISYIATRISRDDQLWSCILELVRIFDYLGSLPPSIAELKRTLLARGLQPVDEAIAWLMGLSILVRRKNGVLFTERGLEATYLSSRAAVTDVLRMALDTQDYLELIDLEQKMQFPPSLLLKGLQDLEKRGLVSPLTFNGHQTNLVWISNFPQADEQARLENARGWLKIACNQVLLTLSQVPYPLGTLKLAEGLNGKSPASYFSTTLLLLYAESMGLIQNMGGNGWSYPWKRRITDYLGTQSQATFSADEIMTNIGLPPIERIKVYSVLEELRDSGQVIQILPGLWAAPLTDPAAQKMRMQTVLSCYCRRFIIRRLTAGRGFERRTLADAKDYLQNQFGDSATRSFDLHRICEDTISAMMKNDEIERIGILLKLKVRRDNHSAII